MPEPLVRFQERSNGREVELLLACLRTEISPTTADQIRAAVQGVDWLALIRLAMRHDVMPLLYRNLQQVCPNSVPESVLNPLRARYEAQAAQAKKQAEELLQLLSLFEEEDVFVLPYKGPTLAQRLYGDLALREFSDLDLMVLESDIPKAQQLIRSAGYEFSCLKDESELAEYVPKKRELQFRRADGMLLELHWLFAMRMACVKNDPERFLQRFDVVSLGGKQTPTLALETYLLILSLHATKHRWRELKLICDIAEILSYEDLDWPYILQEANDLGLRRMLAVGVLLAEELLGVPVDTEVKQALKIDQAAHSLAAGVTTSLFEEPDENWHDQADFPFQFKIRERLRDKAGMIWRNFLPKLAPDERDKRFLAIPKSLSVVYYVVRPVRLIWEKMAAERAHARLTSR
jgi:Uncharacterised nucleotidyltransferase